jgi:hypothetical protein
VTPPLSCLRDDRPVRWVSRTAFFGSDCAATAWNRSVSHASGRDELFGCSRGVRTLACSVHNHVNASLQPGTRVRKIANRARHWPRGRPPRHGLTLPGSSSSIERSFGHALHGVCRGNCDRQHGPLSGDGEDRKRPTQAFEPFPNSDQTQPQVALSSQDVRNVRARSIVANRDS